LLKVTEAAILQKSNSELIIDEITLPEKLLKGQVLVELITSGVCGAQINEIDAVKGPDKFLPHLLGHEGYALVLEIGEGVSTVEAGDFVVMHWRPGSGIEAETAKYKWRGSDLNSGWVTTFNRHCVVSENRVTRIEPKKLNKEIIPLLGCALTTALGVIKNEANINASDHLLIFGVGGVGLTLIKVAKYLGVNSIIVVDTNKAKISKAIGIGANNGVIFIDKQQTLAELRTIYKINSPTVAIDTSGQPSAIEICYEVTDLNARIILVGVPKIGSNVNIYTLPLHFGKSIKGSKGGSSNPDFDIPLLANLISENKLDFSDFPTSTYEFYNLNKAILDLRNGLVGRTIIDFEKQ
jgi:S-(hydroxymethyl)glutathione dehydrogenase / alcohol dehydrogenase